MILFDENNCIKLYPNAIEILREFYHVRMRMHVDGKRYMEGMMGAELMLLVNMARIIIFIKEDTVSCGRRLFFFVLSRYILYRNI